MNLALQALIIEELARLESLDYVGLLGIKYLSSSVTAPDPQGNRVTFININPAEGWAVIAYGPDGDEQKYKFLRDVDRGWVYDGVETGELAD